MARKVLGIICCPMVDDNLVYNLENDPEEKNILIVRNGNEGSIKRKLDSRGIGYGMIEWEDVVVRRLEFTDGYNIVICMTHLGLHAQPKVLRTTVEGLVAQMNNISDCIGLYLGMCGNSDWKVTEWGASKGFKPIVTFHDCNGNLCHDCVGINIAGGPKYLDMEKKYGGHLFIFPAMAVNYDDFMNADQEEALAREASITDEMREVLGIEPGADGYMRWLLRMGDYKNILKIDTGLGDREEFEKEIVTVSERTQLAIREPEEKWADLQPTVDIYAECKSKLPQ